MVQICFQGIIFDMDGTLTVPVLDFTAIREELEISPEQPLLPTIEGWPDDRRIQAWQTIERHEAVASDQIQLQPGVVQGLKRFRENGIKLGLLTRNSPRSVKALTSLINFDFDGIMTRDDQVIKPDPETVRLIVNDWGLKPEQVLVVGDFIYDIECANGAGAASCFFANPGAVSYADDADYLVNSFLELEELVFRED